MNLYEFNQQGYDQMPDYNHDDLKCAKKTIEEWLNTNLSTKYYAFICNELRYYTIFVHHGRNYSTRTAANEILDVASSLGAIKEVASSYDKNGIEIWIKSNFDDKTHMYLLFNYDKGVIDLCPRNKRTH